MFRIIVYFSIGLFLNLNPQLSWCTLSPVYGDNTLNLDVKDQNLIKTRCAADLNQLVNGRTHQVLRDNLIEYFNYDPSHGKIDLFIRFEKGRLTEDAHSEQDVFISVSGIYQDDTALNKLPVVAEGTLQADGSCNEIYTLLSKEIRELLHARYADQKGNPTRTERIEVQR